MNPFEELIKEAAVIEAKIGYSFKNPKLLALAFVHRSFVNENRHVTEHNERLEFLGDSILGLMVADFLYCRLPHTTEGELSYLRSRLVEASSCIIFVQKLELGKHLLLGKGEKMNDGRGRESILADLFEALIGAIYIDGGIEAAKGFFFHHFMPEIEAILKKPICNWKAVLQDYCQRQHQQTPVYVVENEEGPDHSKIFTVAVMVNDKKLGTGQGPSKKAAQQSAAENALSYVQLEEGN